MKRRMAMASVAVTLAGLLACKTDAPAAVRTTPRVSVTVDGQGYHPSTVTVPAGRATTLVFTRTSDEGCGQQVVFPSMNLRRDLPLNEPVEVSVTAAAGTPVAFTCGMGMYRGSVVAQ